MDLLYPMSKRASFSDRGMKSQHLNSHILTVKPYSQMNIVSAVAKIANLYYKDPCIDTVKDLAYNPKYQYQMINSLQSL